MPFALRSLAVGMLSLALGLHWGVLQSVAWTVMLAKRAQTSTAWEAIRTTFDGQHPCRLCQVVKEAKAKTGDGTEMPKGKAEKLEAFAGTPGVEWRRYVMVGFEPAASGGVRWIAWVAPPESPPPRRV